MSGWAGSPGFRGELQIWLDLSTKASRRELSAAFVTKTNAAVITQMKDAGTGELRVAQQLGDVDWDYTAGQFRHPLPIHLYRRALVELYAHSWSYYFDVLAHRHPIQLTATLSIRAAARDLGVSASQVHRARAMARRLSGETKAESNPLNIDLPEYAGAR